MHEMVFNNNLNWFENAAENIVNMTSHQPQ